MLDIGPLSAIPGFFGPGVAPNPHSLQGRHFRPKMGQIPRKETNLVNDSPTAREIWDWAQALLDHRGKPAPLVMMVVEAEQTYAGDLRLRRLKAPERATGKPELEIALHVGRKGRPIDVFRASRTHANNIRAYQYDTGTWMDELRRSAEAL